MGHFQAKSPYDQQRLSCLNAEASVKAQQLLGNFIGGEGHSHHGDGTHVVDAHTSVQASTDAILLVYQLQSVHHSHPVKGRPVLNNGVEGSTLTSKHSISYSIFKYISCHFKNSVEYVMKTKSCYAGDKWSTSATPLSKLIKQDTVGILLTTQETNIAMIPFQMFPWIGIYTDL